MSTSTTERILTSGVELRLLREGYGDGAWHGPDLKAALADVASDAAFRRPAPGRHNIAEIAVHHAYTARAVRAKLTGPGSPGNINAEPFILEGDDWFELPDASRLSWSTILDVVEREQERLAASVADITQGRTGSPLAESERFDLVLGITCHAVYHAGQIQLIKRLLAAV